MKKQRLSFHRMIALSAFILLSIIISSIDAYGQDGGVIRTTDYGTTPTHGSAYYWRGYSFKLKQETVVTHIIGGGRNATTNECGTGDGHPCFSGAIFSSKSNENNVLVPDEILAQVYFAGDVVNQEVGIVSLTLNADTWYFIAQGDLGNASHRVYHWYVEALDVDDLILASQRIDDWKPGATDGCHYWTAGDPEEKVVNVVPTTNQSRPALGIRYETTASLPVVETLSTPMYGKLTNKGNAPTALYIEYGTDEDLESGTTLNLAESAFDGDVPYEYGSTASGLTPSTTYYYRARAINDAGRADGAIIEFSTPDPPAAPTITTIDEGNQQLSVNFTTPGGDVDNYQYSLDNGSTWTSRSPASNVSPLVISGLTNGTTYDVKIRAVYQGIEGDASNMKTGTPGLPHPTNITATHTQLCAGGSTTLTAEGEQGTVYWYTSGCGTGETDPPTGNSITVSPTTTTTYYAMNYENGVFSTDCASIQITVIELQQFRSISSGNWTVAGHWEQYNGSDWIPALCYPGQFAETDPDALVSIKAGHIMDIQAATDIEIPKLEIEDTGRLNIKIGGKLNVQQELKLDESTGAAIVVE